MSRGTLIGIIVAVHTICLFVIYFQLQLFAQALPQVSISTPYIRTVESPKPKTELNSENNTPTTTIFFTGDVMLGRHVEYLMTTQGSDYPFRGLSFLRQVKAYVVGNFEASVPAVHRKTPNFGFTFSVDKAFLEPLKDAGFTHLSLANNHATDYGESGFFSTLEELKAANFKAFGHPRLVTAPTSLSVIEVDTTRVALLGLHTLFATPSKADLETLFATAEAVSDLQVVYVHWGTEYESRPNPAQRELAAELVSLGADFIIGHHPHVIQSIEYIDTIPVFYSLGNFIFDQYFSLAVQQGLVLKVDFAEAEPKIELIPVTSRGSNAQPRLMSEIEKRDFLTNLATLSDENIAHLIAEAELPLFLTLASSSETAIMNQ